MGLKKCETEVKWFRIFFVYLRMSGIVIFILIIFDISFMKLHLLVCPGKDKHIL